MFPWKFQFYVNEIRAQSSPIQAVFHHVGRSANGFVDSLAKEGVDRSSDLVVFTSWFCFWYTDFIPLHPSFPFKRGSL